MSVGDARRLPPVRHRRDAGLTARRRRPWRSRIAARDVSRCRGQAGFALGFMLSRASRPRPCTAGAQSLRSSATNSSKPLRPGGGMSRPRSSAQRFWMSGWLQRLGDGGLEPRQDRLGRAGRRADAVPRGGDVARHGLGDGRDLGRRLRALGRGDAQPLQLAARGPAAASTACWRTSCAPCPPSGRCRPGPRPCRARG